ncbi:MAG: hypothetical protein ACR2JB_15855 [Bryobacteraceae bacterium]
MKKSYSKIVEQRLAAAIPANSTAAEVLDYLNGQRIEHSQYLRNATNGNSIKAMIRKPSRWSLVKTDYAVIFRFDERDRLIAYHLRPAYTGP